MSEIYLDDDSIPMWVRIEECMRMLDLAVKQSKERGRRMVEREIDYYTAKAEESYRMLEAGYANTYIQTVIKGQPKVAAAMGEYHAAEVEYKNANEAIQAYKLKLRVMEAELEREYGQSAKA